MFKLFAAAAGVALLALAPGVAGAQEPDDGLLCIYDAATNDYEAIAEAFLYGEDEAVIASSNAALDKATQACSDRYKMSEEEAAAAREMAVYGLSVDYLSEDLMFMGVTDAVIDGVFNVFDALDEDDLDLFLDTGWRNDADFVGRLKAELLKVGVPDSAEELSTAYDILELSSMTDGVMLDFMLAGLDK
jgi:hypothetical protein